MSADAKPTAPTLWARLRRHFVESFSSELMSRRAIEESEVREEWRARRWRNAYQYILLLVAVAVLPLVIYNFHTREWWTASGTSALLIVVIANLLLLWAGRDALASPAVVLLFAISLVMLSLVRGQEFGLFLLYPLMVALPVLVRLRWAVVLGVCAVAVLLMVLKYTSSMTTFVIGLSLGLTWVTSAWLVFAVTEQARRLKGMAITDPLTGAYNRRYLELRAGKALENWSRYQRPECLLILDIDHFKRINDKFGHAVGDRALKTLVDVVQQRIRSVDTLCRFGGEEFVLLLSEAHLRQAERVADQIRKVVEKAQLLPSGNITISVGVCEVSQAENLEHWFKLADNALYLAKKKGRNRVEVASGETVTITPLGRTIPEWR